MIVYILVHSTVLWYTCPIYSPYNTSIYYHAKTNTNTNWLLTQSIQIRLVHSLRLYNMLLQVQRRELNLRRRTTLYAKLQLKHSRAMKNSSYSNQIYTIYFYIVRTDIWNYFFKYYSTFRDQPWGMTSQS